MNKKKIFAVLMSVMMMVTFMPTMAFAETAPTCNHKWTYSQPRETAATCTEPEHWTIVATCASCDATQTITDVSADAEKKIITWKGIKYYIGINGEKLYSGIALPNLDKALGHYLVKTDEVVEPTCLCEGYTVYKCDRDGCTYTEHKDIVPVSADAHKWVVKEVVAPTCLEKGYTIYKCVNVDASGNASCDATKTGDETNALGHDYQWVLVKAPTFTEVGAMEYKCTRCGEWNGSNVKYLDKLTLAKATAPTVKVGKKYAKVTVKKVANASKYQIAYKVKGGKYKYKTVAKTGTYKIKSLKSGKKYTFKVRALGIENEITVLKGAFSATKTVTIK